MLTSTTPYNRPLDNGLVMKSINNQQDVERLAAFNGQIFGEGVSGMTSGLILHHPQTRPHHWLFVEDEASSSIVSSLCLIPWQWRYEDVILKAGEMGIVSTLESYRNRGLVRAMTNRHQETLREESFDLGIIQGIPYFYRQFGYEYAVPLESHWNMQLHNISDQWQAVYNSYHYRAATPDDIPLLMSLYQETTSGLNISAVRSADHWRYLLQHDFGTDMEGETWLLLDAKGQAIGYWRIMLQGFGDGLILSETSRLNIQAAQALLYWLKRAAVQRTKPYIRMNLPPTNDLIRAAGNWGAQDNGSYAWQIHLVDVARLLLKLKPVLERRIAASPLAGLTRKVIINLYREAFELHFDRGELRTVRSVGFIDGGEIRIPPLLLAQLIFGYHSVDELRNFHKDVSVWGEGKYVMDILFPKLEAFIYTTY
ncbi:MAG: GNAT family N-acetyltransferase [Anaerolineaceae bacterium]|nr:GNAT family N-acetyltransferase [Anaerolineaceae bacterium]